MNAQEDGYRSMQVSLDHLLRHIAAYQIEGAFCQYMSETLGPIFMRGEERSALDAGLLLSPSQADRIMGLEVKSAVLVLYDSTTDGRTGPYWLTRIITKENQVFSDLFCIGFPLSPGCRTWVLDHEFSNVIREDGRFIYQYSQAGHHIENVIAACFWPKLTSLSDAATSLRTLHSSWVRQTSGHSGADDSSSSTEEDPDLDAGDPGVDNAASAPSIDTSGMGQQNVDFLAYDRDRTSTDLIAFLKAQLQDDDRCSYVIEDTKYAPLTGDFVICNKNGERVFVELKLGHCREVRQRPGQSADSVLIRHSATRGISDQAFFTYTNSRWTYLLTELSPRQGGLGSERIYIDDTQLPRRMLLVHRKDIPRHWWHKPGDSDLKLSGEVPRSCIVNLDSDFVGQIIRILGRAGNLFRLPVLEDFSRLTRAELAYSARGLADENSSVHNLLTRKPQAYSAAREIKKRRPDWVYQAEASLAFLHRCRTA